MAQFLGKWKSVSMSNMEGIGKALGYSDEMIKMAKASTWTFEFTKEGDRWSVSNESNNTPKSTNTYEKEGKELVTKGPSGKCMKLIIKFDSDTKMTVMEKWEQATGWKDMKLVRTIEGNTMTALIAIKGFGRSGKWRKDDPSIREMHID
ncbi:Hypothetical predicted protein [Mytilus galloprovincialis]|uniref:Lipocalin/cytosolic fatty-acid binding domain-containing protein n=1 Tax=Mytilus galloprovincialis TaxID=29158 RepID=A0A8B6DPL1_MYTGA|nr:Hypothetical predicted protein [Mytilus galloprovincialis]